jgi:uncharacterized protein
MKKTLKYLILFLAAITVLQGWAQIPEKPNPPRLVNDFSEILADDEVNSLETKLRNYNDSTSTQIVVVVVNDIGNVNIADFTYQIGEKWGVGRSGKNNGAVIVVKPKVGSSRGQASIQTGYGLEATITDAISRRIIEKEMVPFFQEGNYYGGLDAATTAIIKLASGEFKADQYAKKNSGSYLVVIIVIIIVIVLMRSSGSSNHMGGKGGGSNLPFWTALFLASQAGRSHSGSWGGFSGGSGGFGGGGGGFGGFGGGSFGGGGASGSW